MKHSLVNPNQIRFNGLELFNNPIRDDEMYIEMDDELNFPIQLKGAKCIFSSRVPKRAELGTCQNFDMTVHNEWNTDSFNIRDLSKIY